jgi:hypothetical protein
VKFCVKLWNLPSEILEMLKTVHDESAMNESMILRRSDISEKM